MNLFLQTTAVHSNKQVTIDSRIQARNYAELDELTKPSWAVVSGVFLFPTPDGIRIPIVKRIGGSYDGCWALLPAGASDLVKEFYYPSLALKRETKEELIVLEGYGTRINVFDYTVGLITDKFVVYDLFERKWFMNVGELYEVDDRLFYFQIYLIGKIFDNFTVTDGELDMDGKSLNRQVKLVSIEELLDMEAVTPTFKWTKENLPEHLWKINQLDWADLD